MMKDMIDHMFGKINQYSKQRKIVVIKSTVPPDTTKKINNSSKNIDVIFNPEFLTERNFIEDFKKQNRIVLGGNKKPVDTVQQVYTKVFPNTTIIKTDSTTAEMIKYFTNTFLEQSEFYGFKKTNGTGNQLEDLILHFSNGVDDLNVADQSDGTFKDLYDDSFIAKRGLVFAINSDGELTLTLQPAA